MLIDQAWGIATTPETELTASDRAEKALIGGVMTATVTKWERVVPPRAEDFARDAHRVVWAAICALQERGVAPDLISVSWELEKLGGLERAGGYGYLASYLDSTDCSQIPVYAAIVKEAALRRRLRRRGAS